MTAPTGRGISRILGTIVFFFLVMTAPTGRGISRILGTIVFHWIARSKVTSLVGHGRSLIRRDYVFQQFILHRFDVDMRILIVIPIFMCFNRKRWLSSMIVLDQMLAWIMWYEVNSWLWMINCSMMNHRRKILHWCSHPRIPFHLRSQWSMFHHRLIRPYWPMINSHWSLMSRKIIIR